MSPTASEKVPNRQLSAAELRTLLEADFSRLLDNLSLLQSCSSFARVGWDLRIAIHIDNALQGAHDIGDHSRPVAGNIINGATGATPASRREPRPELAAVTTIPIPDATESAQLEAKSLHREIDSPNVERLRNGLPVPIERKQADSTTVLEQVTYPPDETLGDGAVVVSDVGQMAAVELGVAGTVHVDVMPAVDDVEVAESAVAFKARIAREADAIEQARIDELERARIAALPVEMTELTDPDDIIAELNAEGEGGRA